MSRLQTHLQARFGRPRIAAPSRLILWLYQGFVESSSPEVRARLAEGLWSKHILGGLLQSIEEQHIERQGEDTAEAELIQEQE
jgi:hypothetical protein